MGCGKMCLSNIASNLVKYQDIEFTDPTTRIKYTYQARQFTGSIRLQSSFWPNSVNSVNCSVWFQEDLPFPGVDLTKLKPKQGDSYPTDVADNLLKGRFKKNYEEVLRANFPETDYNDERLFTTYKMTDQY